MTSERQAAANKRNSIKSSGPTSNAGKLRASQNAYRHGLASRAISSAGAAEQVAELAHAIAGANSSALVREWANTAADAMLDLARVQKQRARY